VNPRLSKYVMAPRVWLTAGLLLVGLSVMVDYHRDQMSAGQVLARKVSAPQVVPLQALPASRNGNPLGEVNVLAEAALDQAVVAEAGSAASPRPVLAVPLYAVGAEPVSPETAQVVPEKPMGLAIYELDRGAAVPSRLADLGLDPIRPGRSGMLVDIAGVEVVGDGLIARVNAVLSAKGLAVPAGALMVNPHVPARAAAALSPGLMSLRAGFLIAGLWLVAVGLMPAFLPNRTLWESAAKAAIQPVRAAGALPEIGFFQPIAAQEELTRESASRAAAASRTPLSRIASQAFGLRTATSRMVRSRP